MKQFNLHTLTAYLLCTAMVLIPFSIAASNILFGVALVSGFISGCWIRGASLLWQHAKPLTIIWMIYIALMMIGLTWSPDIHRGLIILSKQWSWLIIPLFISICIEKVWLNRMLISISLGLVLHLILCVLQFIGMPLPVQAPGGSSAQDPAGLIGHISFGLIYGIWAAWLLHVSMMKKGYTRYTLWTLISFSTAWIFVVQGRSGYIVTIVIAAIMIWKLYLQHINSRLVIGILLFSMLGITLMTLETSNHRTQETLDSLHAFANGDLTHAEERISLWYVAWESWKTSPIIGVGTGGLANTSIDIIKQHPHLNLSRHLKVSMPHNIYLMELVRWGPTGLIVLLAFLYFWIKLGWNLNWQSPHLLLISLSGIALAVHGLTSQSIEEYHASVYTAVFLSIGLAALAAQKSTENT